MKADGRDTNSPPRDRRSGPPGLLAAPGGLQCELPFRAPGSFSQADCSRGFRGRIDIGFTKVFSFQERSNSMNFKVILQEAEEGGYIVSCPALPGCHSQGDDVEEALKNIKEAIVGCLESLANERTKQQSYSGRIVEVTV